MAEVIETQEVDGEYIPHYPGVPADEEAPKVLLIGQPGAGKTHAIASLLESGLEVFVIFTEQGKESLLEACIERGISMEKLHWTRVAAGSPGFGALKRVAKTINRQTQAEMQSEKGLNQSNYQQMIELIGHCEDFVDQNGVSYGNATDWGNDRALVIDGLSGMNTMCMDLVVGAKPIKTIADWGIAMDAQMRFINQCANSLTAMFVLVAHLELNKDEVEGKIYRYPKVLGNKNTYDFGKHFSDVILASDEGDKFKWSTKEKNMQLKTRNLARSNNLKPTFVPLVDKWASRYQEGKVNG